MEIFITATIITLITIVISIRFNLHLKQIRAHTLDFNIFTLKHGERLLKCEQATAELQLAMATAHRFMSVQRTDSMNAAMKAATENPDKYLEGSYFMKPEEIKKDEL